MIDSRQDQVFVEPKSSAGPKLLAALSALLITGLVFAGYTFMRKRHAETTASSLPATTTAAPKPSVVLIIIDEALIKGGKTTLGGIVRNTSSERLEGVSVELELKRRKDAGLETRLVALDPPQLESQQEGRYLLELKAQDYSSARLVSLKAGPGLVPLPYATAQGQKRPLERLEPKTIIVGKPASKGGDFLNSPDNPARVP
jgi:hypothetical protein